MPRRLRPPRPSHGTIVAYLALFLALGGTTYAAATIGSGDIKKNAVLSRHIKNGQVKHADLGGNTIATGNVIDHSLLTRDFKPGQLPRGPAGPAAASILTGVITTSAGGTYFGAPSGASTGSATETDLQTLTPAGASITARDLSLSWPPGYALPSGEIASITLRVNGADTVLSCPLPVGGSACQDSSHAVRIPPNSRVDVKVSNAGSGAFGTTQWEFGWRAVP